MQQELFQILMGALGGIAVIILGAIWNETRKNSEKLQEICIKVGMQDSWQQSTEKILEKLPCLNNLVCPKG
jgi:hypothetical protein